MTARHFTLVGTIGFLMGGTLRAQSSIPEAGRRQIASVLQRKRSFTRVQRKQSSELVFAGRRAREAEGTSADSLDRAVERSDGMVLVDIATTANAAVETAVAGAGGQVISSFSTDFEIRALVPVSNLDTVAATSEVRWMRAAEGGGGSFTGSVTSQ